MAGLVQYPTVGCIVEYFDANTPQIGVVIEDAGGKLRLLLPNRRETKIPSARVLPWAGPQLPGFSSMSKDALVKAVEACRSARDSKMQEVDARELWELAQGEVERAPARWFAELMESEPDADTVAAYGHALIQARTLFRYNPPSFEVFDAKTVERREEEARKQNERERILATGSAFMHTLWNCVSRKTPPPAPGEAGCPDSDVCEKLEHLLFARMADPETQEEDALWRMLVKGLPDVPHIPVQLLEAWGKVPPHYNFWYDRAGYEPGDAWWYPVEAEARALVEDSQRADVPVCDIPFVSIDGDRTVDVDDAFYIEETEDGAMRLTLALACPAFAWKFGSAFDKAVLHRGTSIYLPEGDSHMLPEFIGTDGLSLRAGEPRLALVLTQDVNADGTVCGECTIGVRRVTLSANLRYADCQAVLDGTPAEGSAAQAFEPLLRLALRFSEARLAARIATGAVTLEREDVKIVLSNGEDGDVTVDMAKPVYVHDAMNMVAEMMILASASAADWAAERGVPMLYRTQDVALPKEYAGVWKAPQDVSVIMHAMVPSVLDVHPRPHAALGLPRYAPMTSPLRRYADLVNEAQLISSIMDGAPRFDEEALTQLLLTLDTALDAAGQVQRFRPRYWKLLYFRQKGDQVWWPAVVTEENDQFVNVCLPEQDLCLRGKRKLFDERTCPGMPVSVRIGKVNPLYNDIQIVDAMDADSLPEES